MADDDFQLALYLCYELHYRGLPGVDDRWEWDPGLIAFRGGLEEHFDGALSVLVGVVCCPGGSTAKQLWAMVGHAGGPSLSAYIETRGTLRQVQELAVHRSAYQLTSARILPMRPPRCR